MCSSLSLSRPGHIRDPSNQVLPVKNLRIAVNNVVTRPAHCGGALSPAQRRLLGDVVSSCQPAEGGVANVITAGDYDLNISGEKKNRPCVVFVFCAKYTIKKAD